MKRFIALGFAVVFSIALVSACGSPCSKAFDKYMDCAKKQGVPKAQIEKLKKKMKKRFMKDCKGKSKQMKKCLDLGCKKFERCAENLM